MLEVKCSDDYSVIKNLFTEYSQIKGADGCFAIKKIDAKTCEGKRLFIRPEYRGKGYARIFLNSMIEQARILGYELLTFTTKPDVMKTAYELYKRMDFEETGNDNGVVSMEMSL